LTRIQRGIEENIEFLPKEFNLTNYPNPFNPVTQIKFALTKTTEVKLSVYNVNGQKIAELANGVLNAGKHTIEFDGSRLNSGVYYYTLETEGKSLTQKMVLMK
jgi:flagellar hook assembly protein FlgD